MSLRLLSLSAIVWITLGAAGASAYAILEDYASGSVESTHESTLRWSSVSGLSDGIQVGVEENFAQQMGATTPEQIAAMRERVVAAFEVWENEVLHFEIVFDVTDATVDPYSGHEIDLLAIERDEFPLIEGHYGFTQTVWQWFADRPLTNGQSFPGRAIVRADIYIDREQIDLQLSSLGPVGLDAIQRIMSHEIGHTIGLGHPNVNADFLHTNYDTDLDPDNPMEIDPADPFADLTVSPNRNNHAILSNRPCGPGTLAFDVCADTFVTELSNDDIGARDVFYPVPLPEPSGSALLGVGGLLVGALARRRAARHFRAV